MVTSTYTGITYRNIYCAICHGVLDLPDITPGEGLNNLPAVDFWWSTTRCRSSEIVEELVKSRDVLERKEWLALLDDSLSNG